MVKIRMKRLGRSHRAFFRLHAIDGRTRRDGRSLEELGFYDPIARDQNQALKLNKERIEHWLKMGAQASPTVAKLLKSAGIAVTAKS
ncbi:MAG: 30S ribosomal protein S16 [Phycisphaerae bacterium]